MRLVCHPDNLQKLEKHLDIPSQSNSFINNVVGISITTDKNMPITEGSGKFVKVGDWKVDEPFITWVEEDGYIIDPPIWMIQLGLIKEERVMVVYQIDDSIINNSYQFDFGFSNNTGFKGLICNST